MADTKISALTAASALAASEVFPVVQSSTTKKATFTQLMTLVQTGAIASGARVLWYITGADMNSTSDQAFTKVGTFTNHLFVRMITVNASANLTTAVGGIYSATSKGGTAIVASSQAYTGATTTTGTGQALTLAAPGVGLQAWSALYLSLTTPQGSAATADIYLIGIPLS